MEPFKKEPEEMFSTDVYCPFIKENGDMDKSREILEFAILEKDLGDLQVEDRFLMTELAGKRQLECLVVQIVEHPHIRHDENMRPLTGVMKVRCMVTRHDRRRES